MPFHKICSILSLILLCLPGYSHANDPKCAVGNLTFIANQNSGTPTQGDFSYRLNELLKIEVTGSNCIKAVKESFQPGNQKPQLFFDGIVLQGVVISIEAINAPDPEKLTLNIFLRRTPDVKNNKKSWDTYLEQQSSGFIMHPVVGLSLNGSLPLLVTLPTTSKDVEKINFYIADNIKIFWTTVFGFLLFFTIFYLLIKNPTSLRDKNSELYSLGKSQMAFWGLLVVISFSSIWFLTETIEYIPDQIFLLMGISGVTGLSSVVIGQNKKDGVNKKKSTDTQALLEEQTLLNGLKKKFVKDIPESLTTRLTQITTLLNTQPVPPQAPKSKGFFQDICNGGDGMAFHRLQAVLWTIVLGVVFVVTIATKISMPEFPKNLLYLLGISNLTYIGFKFPQEKKPPAST